MKKTFFAVLHLSSYKESVKVYQLAGRVITAITNNPVLFKDLISRAEKLNTENSKLDGLIRAKDGSKPKNQAIEDQSLVIFNLLKELIIEVNKIADGDKATILLSGFDSNTEPSEHEIPDRTMIKRIVDGSTLHSAKIYIDAVPYADRYKIQITKTPADESSWETVLDPASVYGLEIENLERGVEIYIRVIAGNCHGWGQASEAVAFLPR